MSWEPSWNLATRGKIKPWRGVWLLWQAPHVHSPLMCICMCSSLGQNVTYSGILPSTTKYHSFLPVVLSFFLIVTVRWERWESLVISFPGGGWNRFFHYPGADGGRYWRVCVSSGPCYDLSPTRPRKSIPVLCKFRGLDFQTTVPPSCTWQLPPKLCELLKSSAL